MKRVFLIGIMAIGCSPLGSVIDNGINKQLICVHTSPADGELTPRVLAKSTDLHRANSVFYWSEDNTKVMYTPMRGESCAVVPEPEPKNTADKE